MACDGINKERLSWVRGNDVLLDVWLYERMLVDGEEVVRPLALSDASLLKVRLKNYYGRVFDISHAIGTEDNMLVTDIPGSIPTGRYSLEVTMMKNDRSVRSFESCLLRVVESNQEANTVLTPIDSGRHAETEMTIQLVSSAVARGKSAYELWLEAGNEGTLQDYLDTFTQPASRTRDGQMTKEAYAKLESIEEATAEDVEEAWQRVFGE